jgi:hypothetical protein
MALENKEFVAEKANCGIVLCHRIWLLLEVFSHGQEICVGMDM